MAQPDAHDLTAQMIENAVQQARFVVLGFGLLLAIWVLYILVQAVRRRRSHMLPAVPIDYKQQRRILRQHTTETEND